MSSIARGGNPRRWRLPTIRGLIVLANTGNGTPLAVIESGSVTALRTGAATAVAAKFWRDPTHGRRRS
jgi:ornithine cyclodeaminase/alanine dehydrogenase-like protein (mu-crystallin family)